MTTKIHCCDGTDIDVTKMTVEEVVKKLKELSLQKSCPCTLQSEHEGAVSMLELKVGYGPRDFREITKEDVGKIYIYAFGKKWGTGFMGWIHPYDVGKRIYLREGVPQVENEEQFQRRVGAGEPAPFILGWRVGKPRKTLVGDWMVPVYKKPSGERDEAKTYYTDDREDAQKTYRAMLKELESKGMPTRAEPKTGRWEADRFGNVLLKWDDGKELYLQGDDATQFLKDIGQSDAGAGDWDYMPEWADGEYHGIAE